MELLLNKLIELWMFDVNVLSKWWMYVPLLIPAAVYVIFFMIKWSLLSFPLWFPFFIILKFKTTKTITLEDHAIQELAKQIQTFRFHEIMKDVNN